MLSVARLSIFFFLVFLFRAEKCSGEDMPSGDPAYQYVFIPAEICAECHPKIYAMWKESMHAHSVDDPIFETSYALAYLAAGEKAKKLCLRCHAPTTLQTRDYEKRLPITAEGVTCDFCHSVRSVDLGDPEDPFFMNLEMLKGTDWRRGRSFHDRRIPDSLRQSEFCAACHEYTAENGVTLLGTYSEWKAGPLSRNNTPCQGCHMASVKGAPRDHRMVRLGKGIAADMTSGGAVNLRESPGDLQVRVEQVDRDGGNLTVRVGIRNAGSGHRIPTGIPSRSLTLICEVQSIAQGGILTRSKVFRKHLVDDESGEEFADDAGLFLKPARILDDNRLLPGESRTAEFKFLVAPEEELLVKAYVNYLYQPVLLQKTEMVIHGSGDEKRVGAVRN